MKRVFVYTAPLLKPAVSTSPLLYLLPSRIIAKHDTRYVEHTLESILLPKNSAIAAIHMVSWCLRQWSHQKKTYAHEDRRRTGFSWTMMGFFDMRDW